MLLTTKQALSIKGVESRKSEKDSRKKQPVRAAAVGGSIVRGVAHRMPRNESICTHDRASASERLCEYGCSVDAAALFIIYLLYFPLGIV